MCAVGQLQSTTISRREIGHKVRKYTEPKSRTDPVKNGSAQPIPRAPRTFSRKRWWTLGMRLCSAAG
ncbi:hypothetical protein PDE_02822 [Penicillium oxalicum 114-2]|uniref:Uncharacterized protein n=1 Tax=Penicillium oxalicum (strain 114-2 / CGMCC 5302) TaxID=933388 RepID=S8APN1_PENO1|nr:hypothetical protein PDE_02822 [Penicillium oxalicum 114-2]